MKIHINWLNEKREPSLIPDVRMISIYPNPADTGQPFLIVYRNDDTKEYINMNDMICITTLV